MKSYFPFKTSCFFYLTYCSNTSVATAETMGSHLEVYSNVTDLKLFINFANLSFSFRHVIHAD